MRVAFLTCLLATGVAASTLSAQQTSARFDLDQFSKVARVSDPQFAPDAKSLLVVVSRANLDSDRYDPELTMVDVASGKSKVLVTGRPGLNHARFSPDGKTIAFLATVGNAGRAMSVAGGANSLQLFTMKASGGKPTQISKAPSGIQQFAWSPDGKWIAFASQDEAPLKNGPDRFNTSFEILVNDDYLSNEDRYPTHLWLIASSGGNAKRLTSGAWSLPVSHPPGPPASSITWTPDGNAVMFATQPSAHGSGGGPMREVKIADGTISVVPGAAGGGRGNGRGAGAGGAAVAQNGRAGGAGAGNGRGAGAGAAGMDSAAMAQFAQNAGGLRGTFPSYSPSGKILATMNGTSVAIQDSVGGPSRTISRDIDHGMERAIWMPDNKSLLVGGNDSARVSLWIQSLDGTTAKRLNLGDVSPNSSYYVDMAVGSDGAIAFTGTTPNRPSELYYMTSPDAPVKRLTDANAQVTSLALAKTIMIDWKSDTVGRRGGEPFYENGLMTFPPDYDASKKYPLVLVIHGGPRAASLLSWGSQAQLLAANGWLVFQPNYRGSDNLGATYQGAIGNDAGDGPGRDVMLGVEEVKKHAQVDTTKIGVSGWSYGGYMTSWMIGHYSIWTAAVAGAAVTDRIDENTLGDGAGSRGAANSPWLNQQAMDREREQSPITYAAKMKTPTLVLSDVGDFRVPITQSYKLFHALKDAGVTTQFFAYPVGGHNPADPVLQRDVQARWMGWFQKYLNPTAMQAGVPKK